MSETLIIIGVAAGAFIGTNLDNLLLLTAMYSRFEQNAGIVTAGYFAGMTIIGAITLVIGEVGDVIPLAYLGLLGVIPILMGVLSLWKLFRSKATVEVTVGAKAVTPLSVFSVMISTQLSNSADSIITFTALYADSTDLSDYIIAPTFLAMTGVFSGVAYYSLKHPRLSRHLARHGQYVTPFILVLVGFYILNNTASDLMPGL